MTVLADCFIASAVASAWLGCLGFLRLRDPLDRLHCVTFCNIVAGLMILLATLAADGMTGRTLKVSCIWVISIIAGAATSHATGRAVLTRESET